MTGVAVRGCSNDAVAPQLMYNTAVRGAGGESYRTLLPVVSGFTSLYQEIRALWQQARAMALLANQRLFGCHFIHFREMVRPMVVDVVSYRH